MFWSWWPCPGSHGTWESSSPPPPDSPHMWSLFTWRTFESALKWQHPPPDFTHPSPTCPKLMEPIQVSGFRGRCHRDVPRQTPSASRRHLKISQDLKSCFTADFQPSGMMGQSVPAAVGTGGGGRRSQEQRLGVLEGEEPVTHRHPHADMHTHTHATHAEKHAHHIHTEKHTHAEKHTQADIHTEKHTQTQTQDRTYSTVIDSNNRQ